MTSISSSNYHSHKNTIHVIVKTLSGDLFSISCNKDDELYQIAGKLSDTYPESFPFVPNLIRDEENDKWVDGKLQMLQPDEMIYMVPYPVDYGVSIQFISDNILIVPKPQYGDFPHDELFCSGKLSIYESIIHLEDFVIYFPFLVYTPCDGSNKRYCSFRDNLFPLNNRGLELYHLFVEKRKEVARCWRWTGWEQKINSFQQNIFNEDYIYLQPRYGNLDTIGFGSINNFLEHVYMDNFPDENNRDDFPCDNAYTFYRNQFIKKAFKDEFIKLFSSA
jgi:hypothetical protein